MSHKEGGWPSNIDPNEAYDVNRLKKKLEKESRISIAVPYLTGVMKDSIRQNNQIDLFEEYFVNEPVEHFVEQLSLKTLMLFKCEIQFELGINPNSSKDPLPTFPGIRKDQQNWRQLTRFSDSSKCQRKLHYRFLQNVLNVVVCVGFSQP